MPRRLSSALLCVERLRGFPPSQSEALAISIQRLLETLVVTISSRNQHLSDDIGQLGDSTVQAALFLELGFQARDALPKLGHTASAIPRPVKTAIQPGSRRMCRFFDTRMACDDPADHRRCAIRDPLSTARQTLGTSHRYVGPPPGRATLSP
jgi:hypothetical protein